MRCAPLKSARAAAVLAGLAGVSCSDKPEVDQIAQHSLIGLSAAKLNACLGRPMRTIAAGVETIWVYRIGTLQPDGAPFAFGLNENLPPYTASAPCDVRFVIDRYGVKVIEYTLANGAALPLGQSCRFAVERCLRP